MFTRFFIFWIWFGCCECFLGLVPVNDFVGNAEKAWNEARVARAVTACDQHWMGFLRALAESEEWALDFWDSSAKVPSGVRGGNTLDFGAYDRCLSVNHYFEEYNSTMYGKHCLGYFYMSPEFTPPILLRNGTKTNVSLNGKTPVTLGYCIPASCYEMDIQKAYNTLLRLFGIDAVVVFLEGNCQTAASNEPHLKVEDWVVVGFLIKFLILIVLSTFYDSYKRYKNKARHKLLIVFSIYTNMEKLLSTKEQSKYELRCIYGIRFLSMLWIIQGHTYFVNMINPAVYNKEYLHESFMSEYVNTSVLSVDTFLLLSGLLTTYLFLIDNTPKFRFNVFSYYVYRYLRLTPVLLVVVMLCMTLLPYLGSGPMWPGIINPGVVGYCRKYWWTTLLYVQNYVNPSEMCVSQSWYLSVDMQLFLLSPAVLTLLVRYSTRTLYWLLVLAVLGIITPYMFARMQNFSAVPLSEEVPASLYLATHIRFGPYVIGIILGYLIFRTKGKYNFKKIRHVKLLNISLWIISLITMLTVIFGTYNVIQHPYVREESSWFFALRKNVWALSVGYIIFSCVNGYGGVVNWFLSTRFFQVMSRLTYCMFLTQYQVIVMMLGQSRVSFFYDDVTNLHSFWGNLFFILAASVCLYFAVETPVTEIANIALCRRKRDRRQENQSMPNTIPEATISVGNIFSETQL